MTPRNGETAASPILGSRSFRAFVIIAVVLLSDVFQWWGSEFRRATTLSFHGRLEGMLRTVAGSLNEAADALSNDAMLVYSEDTVSKNSHNPQRFSNSIQLNVDRGLNIINWHSGFVMGSWVCHWRNAPKEKQLNSKEDVTTKLRQNDTIAVGSNNLKEFVTDILPHIQVDFVLVTPRTQPWYPTWIHNISDSIVEHPHLLHWFAQDIGMYTGGQGHHPKVSPFPLGLKQNMPGARAAFRKPVAHFRKIFLETLEVKPNRTTKVMATYTRKTNEKRKSIPSGKLLDYEPFLRAIAQSQYVLSPDGDHPDCHRNYEAIGMGAVPITELDPVLYRHFKGGPAIFNNSNWNITDLEATLPSNPVVNRNLIFEEYWMEYMERVVGRPLRWWDVVQEKASGLEEFALKRISTTEPAKPVEAKPLNSQSNEAEPLKSKPSEDKPESAKPSEDKPSKDKPAEDKRAETKPPEDKPVDAKPAEDKPLNDKPSESETKDAKLSEDKLSEAKSLVADVEKSSTADKNSGEKNSNADKSIAKEETSTVDSSSAIDKSRDLESLHNPERFSNSIKLNVDRGLNIINWHSGFAMASWVSNRRGTPKEKQLNNKGDVTTKLRQNDTIAVGSNDLREFVTNTLPHIQEDFVLVTPRTQPWYPTWIHNISNSIVEHPHLIHWFAQDIGIYTGGQGHHPKVSPFPLGLKQNMPGARAAFRKPVAHFRKIFLETLEQQPERSTKVMATYTRKTNEKRKSIPSGKLLDYEPFLRAIAQSQYVISPDGDHPDCHRNYEAIGMGAVPITELDPVLYRHFKGGPAIFNNSNWNITDLEATLPSNPVVNRNLIFEEYWMEYIERVVGRPLRWWDVVQKKACNLEEFALDANVATAEQSISAKPLEAKPLEAKPSDARVEKSSTAGKNSGMQKNGDMGKSMTAEKSSTTKKGSDTDKSSAPATLHNPEKFSKSIQRNVDRGLNILNWHTGAAVASWAYRWKDAPEEKMLRSPADFTAKLRQNDTIAVSTNNLKNFVDKILPHIQEDFVLVTPRTQPWYPTWIHNISNSIVEHPHLLHWFGHDIGMYTGGQGHHPKVSPFPLGLKQNMGGAKAAFRKPVSHFRKIFLETLDQQPERTTKVMATYTRKTNENRKSIPSGPLLEYEPFLRALAASQYVLSPNGDHPDCHRTYEAIGMGAVPITELDPFLYRHLEGAPAIFNNSNWNITDLEATLPSNPVVNRNLIFEEYWIEYMERVVGRPLRWWDVVQKKACTLEEFVLKVDISTVEIA